MSSKVVRIPEAVYDEVNAAAHVLGATPAELLRTAWETYRETPEFMLTFETARKAFVTGDLVDLAQDLAQRGRQRAARRAAGAARAFDPAAAEVDEAGH